MRGALCIRALWNRIETKKRNEEEEEKNKKNFFSQHKSYASYIIHGDKIMNPTSSRGGISSNETTHGLNAIGFLVKRNTSSFALYNSALSYLHLNGHSSK